MADVSTTSIVVTANPHAAQPPPRSFWRNFLSELNPLQYIPVVGSVYRAITGDTIPEAAREAGSLVVSGLTSGPIGIATNVALLAAEHATGIDPEKIGQNLLADIGIGHHTPAPTAIAAQPPPPTAAPPASTRPVAWSPAQLTAYGVTTTPQGDLQRGSLSGSDVLNAMELARTRTV